MQRERIAVLGGGAASLFAVLALTDQSDWADRFEIDVYALGWRLGGKGASSRDPATGRNTEHGLHVLGGFYHNSFRWLRSLYRDWAAIDPAHAIPFEQAFIPQSHCDLMEGRPGRWRRVRLDFATDDRQPGVDPHDPDMQQLMRRMAQAVTALIPGLADQAGRAGAAAGLAARLLDGITDAILALLGRPDGPDTNGPVDDMIADAIAAAFVPLRQLALLLMGRVRPASGEPDRAALVAVGAIVVIGWLRDRLYTGGFDALDREELGDWMLRHGATPELLEQPYCRAGYDYLFAYEGGRTDPASRSLSAAVALRWFPRMLLCYHGALFWHMHGGMGEIVFTPLHDVLKARGVRFHFFRRVTGLTADATGVSTIAMLAQADPLPTHDPLIEWHGRRVWPPAPRHEHLAPGACSGDLECAWADHHGRPEIRLHRGADFDRVLLGIGIGALATIAAPLAAASPPFARMLAAARTAPAAGVQIWTATTGSRMGAQAGMLTTAFHQPFASAADMSFLLPQEQATAGHLLYLCGTLAPPAPPGFDAGSPYPAEQAEHVRSAVATWIAAAASTLLPRAPLDYGTDIAIRANVSPSDHYVLSPPGTLAARLPADGSGFPNLTLAGDWTRNGLDAGAFESAVMSGLHAAAAISGRAIPVWGAA